MAFDEPSFLVRCECMMGIVVGRNDQEFTPLDPVGGPIQPNRLLWSQVGTSDLHHERNRHE